MSKSRPSKRPRPDDGGAFHDTIPFLDDIHVVHAREGRLRRVARETVWTASTERSSHHASDPTWTTATSWEPLDDPELALDPDGQWYDEAVFGDVMQPNEDMPRVALPKKQKKSKVAVSTFMAFFIYIDLRYDISDAHMLFGRKFTDNPIWRRLFVSQAEEIFRVQRNVRTASCVMPNQVSLNTAVWNASSRT
jgi:hypothetical protein